jgi:alpha-D-xyloside xylohydrolase
MFGEALLIAPLTVAEGERRNVYLPQGEWYDFWTGERYDGGAEIEVSAGIETIPVFARSGSIIPLAAPLSCVTRESVFDIELKCYGSGGEFTLYEDDGFSFDYRKNCYNEVHITRDGQGNIAVKRTGNYDRVKYRVLGG